MSRLRIFGFTDMYARANGEDELFHNLAAVKFYWCGLCKFSFCKISKEQAVNCVAVA